MKAIRFKPKLSIMVFASLVAILLNSCMKSVQNIPVNTTSLDNLTIPSGFKFSTTKDLNVQVAALDNTGSPVSNIMVKVYTDLPEKGGELILSGVTDNNGIYSVPYKIPAWMDSLAVGTDAIGFINMQKVSVNSGSLRVVLGGKNGSNMLRKAAVELSATTSSLFKLLGTFDLLGVPNYLTSPDAVVNAAFLADLNATLPQGVDLTKTNPKLFNNSNDDNLHLTSASDVYVSFVHEGSSTTNTFVYYKYKTGNAPKTSADIDTLFVVFPNASYAGSGGGLSSGNQVKLGTFPPQTVIGWALIEGGFKGSAVTPGTAIYYSDKGLNPEATALTKHTVLFNDVARSKFLLGFEETNRTPGQGSDNDFNDEVFHITVTPVSAVDVTTIPVPTYTATDTDKDGIPDNLDAYPNDPAKAFNNYYPAQGTVGTLAFEDQWPYKGDYDLNDQVIDYNFNQVTNSKNQVVQVIASLTVKAIGANLHSGFGIQLPVNPGLIASVTGTDVRQPIVTNNSNGTEAGQSKATIIVYDDAFNELPYPAGGSGIGVNTTLGDPYVQPKTITLTINLTSSLSLSTFGVPPYNPFIFIDRNRSREVHLIDHLPTDLADQSLFGTAQDDSQPSSGRYYTTQPNQPYAIDIAGPFDHPVEKAMVTKAFLKFYQWGASGGTVFYDWYKNLSGYRNGKDIYTHQ